MRCSKDWHWVTAGAPSPATGAGPRAGTPSRGRTPTPPEPGRARLLPRYTMPGSGRPGAGAQPPSPLGPPSLSAPRHGVTAPLPARPAPAPSLRSAGPGTGGGGRGPAERHRGLRVPSAPGAAAPAGGAAGGPAPSLGSSCQKARPHRAATPRAGGRAGRGSFAR